MIRDHWHTDKRSAFTLVELLVVILIIAILVSLLAAGVMKAMDKIPQVQTSTEITEMSLALRAFMLDYNLSDPPPSTLILYENISLYATNPAAAPSYNFLQSAFGKNLGSPPALGFPWVDWNGNNTPDGPAGIGTPWILEGEQCLVFYLGGIPTAPGLPGFSPQGFSSNNMIPSTLGGKRKGPYFPFNLTRLKPPPVLTPAGLPAPAGTLAPSFPVYIDPWARKTGSLYSIPTTAPGVNLGGTPYAYCSSNGTNNSGYLSNAPLGVPLDCYSIGAIPYSITGTAQYMNSNTWQIISAGKDGMFGIAGWIPASGVPGIPPSNPNASGQPAGFDDQSNFTAGIIGAGQS